jgi:hypothetical protein
MPIRPVMRFYAIGSTESFSAKAWTLEEDEAVELIELVLDEMPWLREFLSVTTWEYDFSPN